MILRPSSAKTPVFVTVQQSGHGATRHIHTLRQVLLLSNKNIVSQPQATRYVSTLSGNRAVEQLLHKWCLRVLPNLNHLVISMSCRDFVSLVGVDFAYSRWDLVWNIFQLFCVVILYERRSKTSWPNLVLFRITYSRKQRRRNCGGNGGARPTMLKPRGLLFIRLRGLASSGCHTNKPFIHLCINQVFCRPRNNMPSLSAGYCFHSDE